MIISTRPITGLEARAGLVAFANMLWTRAGMPGPTIYWDPATPTARISAKGDTVFIAAIDESATVPGTVIRKLAGLIAHEFLHARLTTMTPQVKPYLFALWNGIEDARIERTAISRGILGNAAALFSALLAEFLGEGIDWEATENFPFSLAVYCRNYPGLSCPPPSGLAPVWNEARKRVNAATSSADAMAIAQWVLSQIKASESGQDQSGDQGDDQSRDQGGDQGDDQSGDQSGQGGDQSGDQGGDQPGDQSGDQSGDQGGDQSGDQSGDQGKRSGKRRTPVASAVPADPEAPLKAQIGQIALAGSRSAECQDQLDGHGSVMIDRTLNRTPRAVRDSIPAATKAALRRMLDNSGRSDLDAGRRTGTVDTRAIARAPFDPSIFSRRREVAGIDSAIHLLIDISGSMSGVEIMEARNVASAIYRAGIEAQASVAISIFADWPALLVPFGIGRRGIERIAQIDCVGGTDLPLAVRTGIRAMLPRTEQRRILIVLTDAMVNPIAAQETKGLLTAAEKLGIQTIGIGIGADIEHAFIRCARVDTIDDLGPKVFSDLASAIRRAA